MGHQIAFIYTHKTNPTKNNENIEKIIDIFKKYNIRCENDPCCTCYSTITLPKNYYTAAGTFKKGTTLLFLEGDRSRVRSNGRVFDQDIPNPPQLTQDERQLLYKTQIVFVDWVHAFLEDLEKGTITENRLYLNT